jgi:putative transposase
MEEENLRKMAIEQYLQDKAPASIYREMERSKPWFFKWLRRYQSGDADWYRDRPRIPRSHPHQIQPDTRKLVTNIRIQLEKNPYAQVGTSAIKWEFNKLGITPPSDRTINRILKREGLVKKNSLYPKGVEYPYFTEALGINNIHQADLLGPRYIKDDGRFYSLNVMDLYSHRVFLHPQRRKDDQAVALCLINCWRTMGMPDFLQLDNELCFRGSNRYPRSFGVVLRVCLLLGIELVFIPIREPWRNGVVESFNDTYNRRFFRTQWFHSYRHLRSQSKNFELFHNRHHRYSCLKGKTPLQFIQENDYSPILPPPRFTLPSIDYVPDGTISLIRFIRNDRRLDIFGEHFELPKALIYSYVRVKIITDLHQIQIYTGNDLVITFPNQLPPWVAPDS